MDSALSGSTPPPRVLIFVVAYEAESTLAKVLERIPASIREFDVEVLVIDDSSGDRTFEVGVRAAPLSHYTVTVLYNATNQGYGGNQKLGYAYAIRNGFDFVVLLHGDGQYAPEAISDLLAPLLDGSADAVFGSRMIVPGAARRGGMPLYKYVGNKILTKVQNRLLGTKLSEFHSGFRAYRVSALKEIPFEYNADAFHFDTEIIIQLVLGRFRIKEVPIPTYYGDEICRVNGIGYAKDVIAATVASRCHRLSILYDRKFDLARAGNRHYELKLGYRSSHSVVLDAVPAGTRVLDIGCGPGDFARELVRKGCVVDGADQYPTTQPSVFRHFVTWTEPSSLPIELHDYDTVLLLDVIEHLREPERLLDGLRQSARSLRKMPRLIVTTGNVGFAIVRLQLFFGNFNYGKRGILDMTHTRLYTFRSLRHLFEQCGFRIERMEGVPAPFPLALGDNLVSRTLMRINTLLIHAFPGVFSYQILLTAMPRPTVEALLDDSIAGSAHKVARLRRQDGAA